MTLTEAGAGAGLDNLLIPVVGALILWLVRGLEPDHLAAAGLMVLVAAAVGVAVARSRLVAPDAAEAR